MTVFPNPRTLETAPAAPPVKASRLDSMPKLEPFNMDRFVNDRANTPKQDYPQPDAPKVDEVLPPGDPAAAPPAGTVTPGAQTNRKSARFIIQLVDRLQKNAFALVATNNDPEVFGMTHAERDELTDYLEEGVAQGKFQVPWWIPFAVCLLLIGFVNYKKAVKIRKELKAVEPAVDDVLDGTGVHRMVERVEKMANDVIRERRERQQDRRISPAPAPVKPPKPEPANQPTAAGKCLYCDKALPAGKNFCDRSHQAKWQHRRAKEGEGPQVTKVEAMPAKLPQPTEPAVVAQ